MLHPAQTGEGVVHPGVLGLQLLGVVHVPELAAAASAVVGAVGDHPGGGGGDHLMHPPPQGGAAHVGQAHVAHLSPDAALDKNHHALQPGHAGAVAGVALDGQPVNLLFGQLSHGGSHPSARHRRG